MPGGKPAGVWCVHLDPATHLCRIWRSADYPDVCRDLRPEPAMCGSSREEAIEYLRRLELLTAPDPAGPAHRDRGPLC